MTAPPIELRQRAREPGPGLAMQLLRDGTPLSQAEVLRLWREDGAFTDSFSAALGAAPFAAFLWETPPFRRGATRAFEWVLLPSAALAGFTADDLPFAEHVRGERGVRVFDNLGGDARLVVPCAEGERRPTRTSRPSCAARRASRCAPSGARSRRRWRSASRARAGPCGSAPRAWAWPGSTRASTSAPSTSPGRPFARRSGRGRARPAQRRRAKIP